MFDYAENLPVLQKLDRVIISHAPDYRSTALLLSAWFAGQLKLGSPKRTANGFSFERENGVVEFELREEPGRSISRCELVSSAGTVRLQRDQQGEFFRVEVQQPEGKAFQHLLPAGSNSTTSLLLWEISGGSRHQIYRRVLDVFEELL
jgi:hypothetical protein